jgi:hypothetical protein
MDEHPDTWRRTAPRAPEGLLEAAKGAASPPRNRPGSTISTRRRGLLAALWLVAVLPGFAAAGPSLEYGPEAEARFLDRCTGGGASARSCRRLMEELQKQLGYAVFLDLVDGGPEGFGRIPSEQRLATAAAPLAADGGR